MEKNLIEVGIREFRTHLPQYLLAASPVAITRHGETMGFYIPARHLPEKAKIANLKEAALKLENLLRLHGLTEEELLSDFRKLRGKNKR